MARTGFKWLEIVEMAGNGLKLLEMAMMMLMNQIGWPFTVLIVSYVIINWPRPPDLSGHSQLIILVFGAAVAVTVHDRLIPLLKLLTLIPTRYN